MSGQPITRRRLSTVAYADDTLRILPGGRYILASSPKSITCIDALRNEKDDCFPFRYDLPGDAPAIIGSVGYDMTDEDTVILAVVLTCEDHSCACLFAFYTKTLNNLIGKNACSSEYLSRNANTYFYKGLIYMRIC